MNPLLAFKILLFGLGAASITSVTLILIYLAKRMLEHPFVGLVSIWVGRAWFWIHFPKLAAGLLLINAVCAVKALNKEYNES